MFYHGRLGALVSFLTAGSSNALHRTLLKMLVHSSTGHPVDANTMERLRLPARFVAGPGRAGPGLMLTQSAYVFVTPEPVIMDFTSTALMVIAATWYKARLLPGPLPAISEPIRG
ncbi:hypothetical protein [Croceibacterium ferulae]|uniref:hypothetical protein n=1 Tax=Croceibacterium ferulae TaxID=1854641 RepID=UPI000EAF94CC|nr:hypothetical protein [Croceibacterium ferulae]